MTFAQFFGCDVSGELQRTIDDTLPITFDWSDIEATIITAEVAFDNINYVATIGSVISLGNSRFQLNYNPQDRPTNPGLITYKFTDNLGNVDYLTVIIVGDPVVESLPDLKFSEYGPRRIKTKKLEIEQFDPEKLQDLKDRKNRTIPTFCSSRFCVGRNDEECLND